jgi:hypothetical protein
MIAPYALGRRDSVRWSELTQQSCPPGLLQELLPRDADHVLRTSDPKTTMAIVGDAENLFEQGGGRLARHMYTPVSQKRKADMGADPQNSDGILEQTYESAEGTEWRSGFAACSAHAARE